MTTAGETADTLSKMVLDEIEGQADEVSRQIVHSRVLRALTTHYLYTPPKSQTYRVEPMTDVQAKAFEDTPMKYGKHVGKRIGDVPIDYLCYLADPNEWTKDLKRYLASDRVKERGDL